MSYAFAAHILVRLQAILEVHLWVYLLRAALVGIFGLDWPLSLVVDLLACLAGCLGGALFGLVRVLINGAQSGWTGDLGGALS